MALAVSPAASAAAPAEISAVRPLDRTTPLMVDGRPAALLRPADPAYDEAAALLASGLADLGVRAEEVKTIAAADPARRTVICLGSMLNNPLLERLYWNRYTFVDALTPGAGRFLLHTVYDPYPFNGGHNVIVVGASDPAGANLGVKRLLSQIRDHRLPYIFASGPGPAAGETAARGLPGTMPNSTFLAFLEGANRYLQTGSEAYAQEAIAALEVMTRLYAPGGLRGSGTTLQYQRLPFHEEKASWEINCAWDAFEECPLLTDAQRQAFANVLLKFTRELKQYCSGYKDIDEHYLVSWNHTSFPLLGIHFGARYFDRYYELPDMPEMLAKAKLCFTAQARSWKPEEDADTYLTYTMAHVAIYGLAENQMGYFESGNLKRYADYTVGIRDNRGRPSGFGDSNSFSSPTSLAERALPLALWWTGDGAYRWLMDRYTRNEWQNPYERGVLPVRPDRFIGVNVFALDRQVYELTQKRPSYNESFTRADVPSAEAFDKITFRENWDPDGQYLILDGLARGKHLHFDGNSILGFVEGGERWLLDHDGLTRNTTEHTMLSILRDGRSEHLVPSLAGLAASADLSGCGYTRTYMRDYNGCDWQRQILWRQGAWFLIADTVTPRVAGDYTFDLTWKTMDSEGRQRVTKRGDFMATRSTGEAVRQLTIQPTEPVTSWITNHDRKAVSVPVSILHQRKAGAFSAGDSVRFASLMFTSLPDKRRALRGVPISENLVAIRGSEPALAVLGNVTSQDFALVAEAGVVKSDHIALSRLYELRAGDLSIRSSLPLELEFDLRTGRVVVTAPALGGELTIAVAGHPQQFSLQAGRQEIVLLDFTGAPQAVQIIAALSETSPAAPGPEESDADPDTTPGMWSAFASGEPIACIKTADLDTGNGPQLFVCRGNALHCLSPNGEVRWSFNAEGRTRDVAFGELRSSPGQEILLGSSDTQVYLLSAEGELLEERQMSGVPYARSFPDEPRGVHHVGAWDINGDGRNEIIVTLDNSDLQLLTADWQLLWAQHHALHGSMQLSFEDLDGDAKPETILVADKYGNSIGVSPAGKRVYRGATSIGDSTYVVTSLDGGQTRHVLSGSSTGDLIATGTGVGAKPLWRFDNFGYAVNRLRAVDLDGDGRNEIIVASGTGYLYALDAAGKLVWQDRAGYGVNDALVFTGAGGVRVAYGDESGVLRIADGHGRLEREFRAPAPVRSLTLLPSADNTLLIVALSDGRVVAYDVR